MCIFSQPKIKSEPLKVVDVNAGQQAAEAEANARRRKRGYASTFYSNAQSRTTGFAGSKMLMGQ